MKGRGGTVLLRVLNAPWGTGWQNVPALGPGCAPAAAAARCGGVTPRVARLLFGSGSAKLGAARAAPAHVQPGLKPGQKPPSLWAQPSHPRAAKAEPSPLLGKPSCGPRAGDLLAANGLVLCSSAHAMPGKGFCSSSGQASASLQPAGSLAWG